MPINKNISDLPKIATREGYGSTLVELGKKDENIVVLDADLAAATKTSVFGKVFPERHINCGIAEANMAGIAAGLAASGKIPLSALLLCLWQDGLMSRCVIPLATRD